MVHVAIIAARNQPSHSKYSRQAKVPADGEIGFAIKERAQTLWRWLQKIGLDGSNVPALAQS
jgi:hypothetical protein